MDILKVSQPMHHPPLARHPPALGGKRPLWSELQRTGLGETRGRRRVKAPRLSDKRPHLSEAIWSKWSQGRSLAHLSPQRHDRTIWFKPTHRFCSLLSLLNSVVHSADYLQIKPRVSRGFMRQSTRQECSLSCQISLLLSFFIIFFNITRFFPLIKLFLFISL